MTLPLLTTKLSPPRPRADRVSRLGLVNRLRLGLETGRQMSLLSAPAGFGKTTLLGEWVAGCGRRLAWLTLDDGDSDPARFLAYLTAALQMADERIAAADNASGRAALGALINQIAALDSSLLLILDDYHLVDAPAIHRLVTFLLDHQPPNLHLALSTRADPPIPLARLRGRGELTELRLADLRFSADEAAAFMQSVTDLALTPEDASTLARRTEGWIAGLQLAALSLQGKRSPSQRVADFAGSNRYVVDFFWDEVLASESEAVQTFLLHTSVLEQLSADLCDAVLDDPTVQSQGILEYLDRSNLFTVPLDDRRQWYRYHRLFADLLRTHLASSWPELPAVLHRRASAWYEAVSMMEPAIEHAAAAGDMGRAADLIEQESEVCLMRGETFTLIRWVKLLPDELAAQHPKLCALYGWALLFAGGTLAEIESKLAQAERYCQEDTGWAFALRSLLAGLQGRVDRSLALAQEALEMLPEEDQFLRGYAQWIVTVQEVGSAGPEAAEEAMERLARLAQGSGNLALTVTALVELADGHRRQGDFRKAEAVYQRVLELATDPHGQLQPIAGTALCGLGELARERNELDTAARLLLEGIELIKGWTGVGVIEANISLARVLQAQGQAAAAQQTMDAARALAVEYDATDLDDLMVDMAQAHIWIQQNELEAVEQWARRRGLLPWPDGDAGDALSEDLGSVRDRMRKYEYLQVARLWLAQGRPGQALPLLDALLPLAEQRGRPILALNAHLLCAVALQALGEIGEADAAMEMALSLGAPSDSQRVFLDEGAALVPLLERAVEAGVENAFASRLLDVLLHRSPVAVPAPTTAGALAEPLTEREMDVLRLLVTSLSTQEIASHLFVAVSTVRSHTKSIYAKLGVHSRLEAAARAQELDLL